MSNLSLASPKGTSRANIFGKTVKLPGVLVKLAENMNFW